MDGTLGGSVCTHKMSLKDYSMYSTKKQNKL